MKGYKGFAPGMVCRGKQYEEGKVYEEDRANLCESGMHFCENPFEVWKYYPPTGESGNLNEFAEVEALDEPVTDGSGKFCTKKLKIGAKLKFADFVKAGVDFVLEKTDMSAATNTGYCSAATNTWDYSAATNTWDYSAATNTGNRSAATNTGNRSAATNTGDCSAASVGGNDSIAIVTGKDSKAKGALGCWIVCTERDEDWNIVCVKAAKVDGETIKADTFYTLKNGEFEEAPGVLG